MKRLFLSLMAVVCMCGAMAQSKSDDVFIRITDDNMFSKCFTNCDQNGDSQVTYAEAAEATTLLLQYGGRLNIIEDYDFLKFFPNLTTLHVGNTTVESIDLSRNPKLERVNLQLALWLRVVCVANGNIPQMLCPPDAKLMTVIVGNKEDIPADPDQLNLEKHLYFNEPELEEIK